MAKDDLLKTYREKRDFKKTAEPSGEGQKRKAGGNRYLVQKHDATRLHFDFRLEKDGVLKSWAVTRGPSLDPKDKRLAVRTEDHPLDYGDFEGTIPKGEYGGGTVMLWDEGTWEPLPGEDLLDEGKLKFRLDGERLKGNWMLVRIKNNRDRRSKAENWLLFKERDQYAVTEGVPIIDRALTSVVSGRTMEEIAAGNVEWTRAGRRMKETPAAEKKAPRPSDAGPKLPMPKFVEPQMATLVEAPPKGDEWVHEIKYDGYRAIAAMSGGEVRIYTRNGLDWTDRFRGIVTPIADLPAKSVLLDGEVAVPGADGKTDFAALQAAMANEGRGRGLVYYLFDLLEIDGEDLRRKPLVERKARLAELLKDSPKGGPLIYSEHLEGDGAAVYAHAEELGLEGIISKRRDAVYRSDRGRTWLKVKTGQSDEFLVVGWEKSEVKGKRFAALLLATREGKDLVYRGKVGSGFGVREQEAIWPELEKRIVKTPPVEVPREFVRNVQFVKPELVVEANYRGISSDNLLRQASFKAIRRDKTAKDVDALDEPVDVEEAEEVAAREAKPARRRKAAARGEAVPPPNPSRSARRVPPPLEGEAREDDGRAEDPEPLKPRRAAAAAKRTDGENEASKAAAAKAKPKPGAKAKARRQRTAPSSPSEGEPAEQGEADAKPVGGPGRKARTRGEAVPPPNPSRSARRVPPPLQGEARENDERAGKDAPAPKRKTNIITIERDKDGNAIEIEGVKVTNPTRILFPDRKITKRQLIEYQLAIADRILPHVANRPLSLVRCPRGAEQDCFFQKHASEGFPAQFKPIEIREKEGTDIYLYIEDKRGLVAAVQMGALELHIWGSHVDRLEYPDRLVFDFDPDPDIPFQAVKDGALEMRERLKQLGLVSFCMVTGGKGLHVVVPLTPKHEWPGVRAFAEALARLMAQEDPKRYLAVMSKAERKGRIFIDYLRNGRGATAISPFSTRARKGAPLSWPVTWKALDTLEGANLVTVENFAERLKSERGDPWRGYFDVDQVLPL
ncbi:MAG: non-homologous end-joining DNA ligase [Bauldia sp.]